MMLSQICRALTPGRIHLITDTLGRRPLFKDWDFSDPLKHMDQQRLQGNNRVYNLQEQFHIDPAYTDIFTAAKEV
jgi:hypothetical protein